MTRLALIAAVLMPATSALGQTPGPDVSPPALQRPYEALRDFFNYYATAGVDYDTNGEYVLGGSQHGSAVGMSLGGGVSGVHSWSTATFSLSYRGDYRNYFGNFGHANDQSLIASFQKHWKRWTLDAGESGGILYERGAVYGTPGSTLFNPTTLVQSNPYSTELRYEQTQLSATYIQNYRLSFTFSGAYMINRYNYGYAAGFNDASGSGGLNYRLTKRTTLSGTYAHSLYSYQRKIGSNQVDNFYLTLAHTFSDRVSLSGSAGITRASGAGAVIYPIAAIVNGRPATIFALVHYNSVNYLPYFSVTLSKDYKHTELYVTGSDSVTPGNGQFLTSRTLGITGTVNHQLKRANASAGGYYSHLAGIVTAGGVSVTQTRGLDASYSYNLFRHVGLNARYDYLYYGGYGSFISKPDNHLTLSVYFESKDVPLGLY